MAQPAARRRRPAKDEGPSFFDAIAPAAVTPPPTQPKPARVANVRTAPAASYVYVGRACNGFPATAFGNPFTAAADGGDCVDLYRRWLAGSVVRPELILQRAELLAGLPSLAGAVAGGKALGCWCAPEPCHADVLLELIDALPAVAPPKDAPPPPVAPTPANAAPASDWSVVAAMIDAARAAGGHADPVHAPPGDAGLTPAEFAVAAVVHHRHAHNVKANVAHDWTLEIVLLGWANEHAPALAAAWCRAAPRDEPGKLAAIFRDRAIRERQTFPAWACLHWGRAVLELLPMAFPENAAQRWFEAELALGGTAVHDPDARPAVAFVRKVAA